MRLGARMIACLMVRGWKARKLPPSRRRGYEAQERAELETTSIAHRLGEIGKACCYQLLPAPRHGTRRPTAAVEAKSLS